MHCIVRRLLFLMGFIGVLFIFGSGTIVRADTNEQNDTKKSSESNYELALRTTPKGLNWGNRAFVPADFNRASDNRARISKSEYTSKGTLTNNAEIVNSKNPDNPNTSVIKMTNGLHQTGAVWSNPSMDNYFDLDHEQTVSMWLFLGKSDSSGNLPGDGMAFVLQNDPNKENSIALAPYKNNLTPVNGQGLGVWGADWNHDSLLPIESLTKTAIQNSWALEFDTFLDIEKKNITGQGSFFDGGLGTAVQKKSMHIAGGYPAISQTYTMHDKSYPYNYSLNHDSTMVHRKLIDSTWHHITIKWLPNKHDLTHGTLTYIYNDKDPVTGMPINMNEPRDTVSFNIYTPNFHLKNGNKKLYWGFTGATGNNSEDNLLVFESIPSYVDAEAKSAVFNDSDGGKQIKDSMTSIDPDSDIRYTYSLNYKGWTRTWNNINALMNIPKNVTFTSGTVTYPDSTINKSPRPIPKESFKDGQVQYILPEQLDSNSRHAQIELKGKTIKNASTHLTVPSVHTSFEGDNLITGVETQSFGINARLLNLESSSPDTITIKKHENITIPGQVTYSNSNHTSDFGNIVIHKVLNNKVTDLGNIVDPNSGHFSFTINDNDNLNDINTLSFYATDMNNNTSNTILRQINIGGLLAFGNVQENVNFKTTTGFSGNQIIPRLNDWQIEINDSRQKGSSWRVEASTTGLTLDDENHTPLMGNLFFRDSNGRDLDIKNQEVTVASHVKNTDESEKINITNTWNSNDGILLFLKNGNKAGIYQGLINWTLINSI